MNALTTYTGGMDPCPMQARPSDSPPLRSVVIAGNVLTFGFVVGFGLWSFVAPLESAAIAMGVLESESSRKTVQHLEGGIIEEILVRDGDNVEAGQPLIRLDAARVRSKLTNLNGQYWDARAREVRLLADATARK